MVKNRNQNQLINYIIKSTKLYTFNILLVFVTFLSITSCISQNTNLELVEYEDVISGASRLENYLHLLENKKVVIVANQSSTIVKTHLVDSLLSYNIHIEKIMCPEHGFRGKADAGETIVNGIDIKTGIPIVSLYGSHKKPTPEDLENIDLVLFDLQDVGTRFYTYISTMTYVMEACAEQNIPMIILDRPNPNGYFVDGPILESKNSSFVGLHSVPIVYGMTIGEYAKMVVGESWIVDCDSLKLTVIPLKKYSHNMIVKLATKPSPNLPNWQSIYLYPSLCLFEGTTMSIGRGTDFQFQVVGHPKYHIGSFVFTPDSKLGATNPLYKGQVCYGLNLKSFAVNYKSNPQQINLKWLLESYNQMNNKDDFFNAYFIKLAGTSILRTQIENGLTEKEIRLSWQPDLLDFMKLRSKYLIYD